MEIPKAFAITNDVWMVPCLIVKQKKYYQPLTSPHAMSNLSSLKKLRKYWTAEEDQALSEIVKSTGPHNWSSIAKLLNIKLYNSFQIRKGKQCRERWLIHLDPTLKKSKWSKQEDSLLIQKHQELGNKWTQIAKCFIGRNENQVKNRWKVLKRSKIEYFEYKSDTQILEKTEFDCCGNESVDDEYSLDNIDASKNFDDSFINSEELGKDLASLCFLDKLLEEELIESFKQDALDAEDESENAFC